MAELKISLSIDKDVLDALQADLAKAPKRLLDMLDGIANQKYQFSRQLLRELQEYPSKRPNLPFVWSLDPVKQGRARRWYFANVVKGRTGGRYSRTNRMKKSWKIQSSASSTGGIVTVTNDFDRIEYVEGVQQVPSHEKTGWLRYENVLLEAEEKFNGFVIDAWFSIVTEGKTP